MALFDKPQRGKNLKELYDGRPFKILGFEIRENVETMYGPNDAIDLTVFDSGEEDGTALYSGFSAGILQMLKQSEEDDFPVWVRCTNKQLGAGKSTYILTPVSADDVDNLEANDGDIPF